MLKSSILPAKLGKKIGFLCLFTKKNRTFAHVIQLGRHIEILLLDNDCVIVPDFGGFVAHHVSARYEEDDHMWLPPMRTLGFNPQLRINDSLLVQSYVNAYDISYPEALRRIEEETDELRQQLDAQGSYELPDIGVLTINSEGNLQFEPCEAGILSPEFYGFGGCEFITLKEAIKQNKQANSQEATVNSLRAQHADLQVGEEPTADSQEPTLLEFITDDDNDERAIQIKMSWIRNAVAVAAAIVAFFIMATPIANSDLGNSAMSQLQNNLLYKLMPQDTNLTKATPVVASQKKNEAVEQVAEAGEQVAEVSENSKADEKSEAVEKKATNEKNETRPAAVSAPTYCIVLASQVKRSNAEYYVEQLQKQGYKDAQIYVHNNTVRVIYGAYETEAEAYRQLNRMTSKEEFADAWVYQKKVES